MKLPKRTTSRGLGEALGLAFDSMFAMDFGIALIALVLLTAPIYGLCRLIGWAWPKTYGMRQHIGQLTRGYVALYLVGFVIGAALLTLDFVSAESMELNVLRLMMFVVGMFICGVLQDRLTSASGRV